MFCSKDKGHDHLLLSYKTIIVLNFTFRSAWYLELVIVYNTLSYKMVVGTDMFPIWISNGSSPSTENNCYSPLRCSQACCSRCLHICAWCLLGLSLQISYLTNSSSFYKICHLAFWSFSWPPPQPLATPNTVTTSGGQGQGI